MIKGVGTLYAGNVDFADLGRHATPVNDRFYDNDAIITAFATTEKLAKVMDAHSCYDTLFLAEHHFQPEGYEVLPNGLMLAVHLTHLTERLNVAHGFPVAPMWHPLRLAEDYAVADILTKGRVVFGLAKGYHTREVESVGGPLIDKAANKRMYMEMAEILYRVMREDRFSHKGEFFIIPPEVPYRGYITKDITLTPKPKYRHDFYMPVTSSDPELLDLYFKFDGTGILSGGLSKMAEGSIRAFQDAGQRNGFDLKLGERMRLQMHFHLAETKEAALKEAQPWWEENVRMFAPFKMIGGATSDESIALIARGGDGWDEAGVPTLESEVDRGAFYAGPPDGFVAYIHEVLDRYPGLEYINVNHVFAAPSKVMLEQMAVVGREVLPKVMPSYRAHGSDRAVR